MSPASVGQPRSLSKVAGPPVDVADVPEGFDLLPQNYQFMGSLHVAAVRCWPACLASTGIDCRGTMWGYAATGSRTE